MSQQSNIQKQVDTPKDESQLIFERDKEECITSSDFWYSRVIKNLTDKPEESLEKEIVETLKKEPPNMLSVIMERQCFFDCAHCMFPKQEKSSKEISEEVGLAEIIKNIVKQMPTENDPPYYEKPKFIHDGRMLRKWHIDILENVRKERPDMRVGIVDNGSYISHLDELKQRGFKFDWLEISIDGTEQSHNLQRDPEKKKSYQLAVDGLTHAREVTKLIEEGGNVTSLFTLTKLNHKNIEQVADFVFSPNPSESAFDPKTKKQLNYVDGFYITTMTPRIDKNFEVETSPEEFKKSWEQIKKVSEKYNKDGEEKIFMRMFDSRYLEKLNYAVGREKIKKAFLNADVMHGGLRLEIDGVHVDYYPYSIWPRETFTADVDGAYRGAFCQEYSIEELRSEKSSDGSDISSYTFKYLDGQTPYVETYKNAVDKWWEYFGKQLLRQEIEIIQKIIKE